MNTGTQQREFTRSYVSAPVNARLESFVFVEGEARNISLNGIWFKTDQTLPVGNPVRMHIDLDKARRVCICVEGKVVRNCDGGVAVEFTRIDPENYHRLCDYVRYNVAPDHVADVETEIGAHAGIKRNN